MSSWMRSTSALIRQTKYSSERTACLLRSMLAKLERRVKQKKLLQRRLLNPKLKPKLKSKASRRKRPLPPPRERNQPRPQHWRNPLRSRNPLRFRNRPCPRISRQKRLALKTALKNWLSRRLPLRANSLRKKLLTKKSLTKSPWRPRKQAWRSHLLTNRTQHQRSRPRRQTRVRRAIQLLQNRRKLDILLTRMTSIRMDRG